MLHSLARYSLTLPLLLQGGGLEDFEGPGFDWSGTLFPVQQGGGLFIRNPLIASNGAPDTTPPLPINVGGDKEGRFAQGATSALALSDTVFCDVRVDGYVGIGQPNPFGSPFVGFVLRGGATPLFTGYTAAIFKNEPGRAIFGVSRRCNGLTTAGDVLASSMLFDVDPTTECYRLSFEAQGSTLTATLSRVYVSGGVVVEEPIDLLPEAGVQNQLVATDSVLSEGTVGMYCFAPGTSNSVFMDDIEVTDLGCGPGISYCFGDGASAPCPCANETETGEGCGNSIGVGARLAAQGTTSVSANDLFLTASQATRHQFGVVFAGTETLELPFGDGKRCIDGTVVRFPVQNTGTCGALFQNDLVPFLGILPGDTWYFGGWYRDPGGPCGSGFNTTHALELSFTP